VLILAGGGWWGAPLVYRLITFHPPGQILFECYSSDQVRHLCIVNADGSGYTQFASEAGKGGALAWSPDGKRIAFAHDHSDFNSIPGLFVMNSDGSGLTQLTGGGNQGATKPGWSLDGDRIAFGYEQYDSNTQIGSCNVAIISVDGGQVTLLDNSSSPDISQVGGPEPSWSPDGSQIAFNKIVAPDSPYQYKTNIYIMNSDGSNQRKLTSTKSISPSWSPDGTKLAFTCDNAGVAGICVINSDGSGFKLLAKDGKSPTWSPDGRYIAYANRDPWCILCLNSGQLWVMKADGSQQTKITNGPIDQNPAWRPAP
jgi:TolB protein